VKRKLSDIHINKRNFIEVVICKVYKKRQGRKKKPYQANKM